MSAHADTARAPGARPPRLFPSQVCVVVDDVPAVVNECVERFGWGPFQQFTAPVEDAEYRGWRGKKVTEVALGMAGRVQVELIHVHEGHDAVEAYQARYGSGFQHLGVGCRSRDAALAYLESLGGSLHEKTDYAGLRIAFVDTPVGDSLFELLESTGERGDGPDLSKSTQGPPPEDEATAAEVFTLDRATIVTADLDRALPFFARAFRWEDAEVEAATLRHPQGETRMERVIGRAGTLELELLRPVAGTGDPYTTHLARGDHGLVHAGGPRGADTEPSTAVGFEWLETGESFVLDSWAGGLPVQIRSGVGASS